MEDSQAAALQEQAVKFMRENWRKRYTYNQIAEGIGYEVTSENAREFHHLIQKLVVDRAKTNVILGDMTEKKQNNKRSPLYCWSPYRRRYDDARDPALRAKIVRHAIYNFVTQKPYSTRNEIHDNVRLAFVHLSRTIISGNLAALVESGKILIQPGPRRANLHVIAPTAASAATAVE